MKISQLSTDQAFDALCQITPYVSNIVADQQLAAAVGRIIQSEGTNKYGFYMGVAEWAAEFLPLLFRKHREDVYGILSVVNQKERGEIRGQSLMETMEQLKELFADQDLADFFKSLGPQGKSA